MAIQEAGAGIRAGHGGPFGSVIVKAGKVVGRGHNMVVANNDSTAHGEIMAIKNAEENLATYDLIWQEKSRSVRSMDNLLAADDFGNGINDMERIDLMKPDIVKLDRELISGIDHDREKQDNVMRLVLDFHSKDMLVVAEGVEEKEEFEYLAGLGVDLFQGFYLARPA